MTHEEKNAVYREMSEAVAEVGQRHPGLSPPEGVIGCCAYLILQIEFAYAEAKGNTSGDIMICLLESLSQAGADVSKINRVPMPKDGVEA